MISAGAAPDDQRDADSLTSTPGGLLNICKPQGVTSFRIVKEVRRLLGVKKVGHCGTLDPMASGVLLVLFGRATRQVSAVMLYGKVYRAVIRLGIGTDTGDVTGKIVEETPVPPLSREKIEETLLRFVGSVEQIPPMYSALKYRGKNLYHYARKGILIERAPRTIEIRSISLLSYNERDIEIRLACSKGTYVRTLAEDIGKRLGTAATLSSLVREAVGPYSVESAIPGESLLTMKREELMALCQNPATSAAALNS